MQLPIPRIHYPLYGNRTREDVLKSTHFSTPKRFDSLEGGCRATGGITGCFSAYGNNPSFQGFSDQSGLEINQTKSQAFFGANEQNKALQPLGCNWRIPQNYIKGLPFKTSSLNQSLCEPLIDKVKKGFPGWKAKLWSFIPNGSFLLPSLLDCCFLYEHSLAEENGKHDVPFPLEWTGATEKNARGEMGTRLQTENLPR